MSHKVKEKFRQLDEKIGSHLVTIAGLALEAFRDYKSVYLEVRDVFKKHRQRKKAKMHVVK